MSLRFVDDRGGRELIGARSLVTVKIVETVLAEGVVLDKRGRPVLAGETVRRSTRVLSFRARIYQDDAAIDCRL